jgi:deoxycytidylate deaminase
MSVSSGRRLSWEELWTAVAISVGDRSLCVRDQVGAVIVDRTQRIVATGYNGPPTGFPHGDLPCDRWCQRAKPNQYTDLFKDGESMIMMSRESTPAIDYSDCPALHAEANALMVCDRRDREGGTIYVDSSVCYACAKLVANSGLARVVILTQGLDDHRNPRRSVDFMRDCGLEVIVDAPPISPKLPA